MTSFVKHRTRRTNCVPSEMWNRGYRKRKRKRKRERERLDIAPTLNGAPSHDNIAPHMVPPDTPKHHCRPTPQCTGPTTWRHWTNNPIIAWLCRNKLACHGWETLLGCTRDILACPQARTNRTELNLRTIPWLAPPRTFVMHFCTQQVNMAGPPGGSTEPRS